MKTGTTWAKSVSGDFKRWVAQLEPGYLFTINDAAEHLRSKWRCDVYDRIRNASRRLCQDGKITSLGRRKKGRFITATYRVEKNM